MVTCLLCLGSALSTLCLKKNEKEKKRKEKVNLIAHISVGMIIKLFDLPIYLLTLRRCRHSQDGSSNPPNYSSVI
jgi:hypothetical protein